MVKSGVWPSWLGRLVWDQEILGSSPSTPTNKNTPRARSIFLLLGMLGGSSLLT